MPEVGPREIEVYMCNKYLFDQSKEEVIFCNAPQYCDPETKARRHCLRIKIIFPPTSGPV